MLLKTSFIARIIEKSGLKNPRILELACGTARHAHTLLQSHPEYQYVGVEPFLPSFQKAKTAIGNLPNVTLYNQLAYGKVEGLQPASFDIVFSLSALEHIKDLPAFIKLSHDYAKKGAFVVHRYDLGHALHSNSRKERMQVWLGNNFPALLPTHKFVRYVPLEEVKDLLKNNACTVEDVTYHGMPNHRAFEKCADHDHKLDEAARALTEWEYTYGALFPNIPLRARERLFPVVAVWARKE